MFVPYTPHTTVINKTIVYSDTVLSVKDLGNNLKVSTISNVSEYSLERCLKTIFESNPNVIFNTIQYSKNDKKVYFYTNQEISIKVWEESKIRAYKTITKTSEILKEVKNILVSELNKNDDCISLYDVAQLLRRKWNECDSDKDLSEEHLGYVIKSKYGSSSNIIIYDFDYNEEELNIGFKYLNDYDKIVFAKNGEDLYVKKDESYRGKDILVLLGDDLSKLYDKFMQYKDVKQQKSYKINAVNSNFLVDVSGYGASIFVGKPPFFILREFALDFPSYKDEYSYDCNSSIVISTLKGKEDEIFKRIFVRIEDCPEWSQLVLYEIRQNQLAGEKRKEMRKQKRLELTRKFLPFLKK